MAFLHFGDRQTDGQPNALSRSRCRERRNNNLAISAHQRPSLVSDKHVAVCWFQLYLQALVHWCGFHAAIGESKRCILL